SRVPQLVVRRDPLGFAQQFDRLLAPPRLAEQTAQKEQRLEHSELEAEAAEVRQRRAIVRLCRSGITLESAQFAAIEPGVGREECRLDRQCQLEVSTVVLCRLAKVSLQHREQCKVAVPERRTFAVSEFLRQFDGAQVVGARLRIQTE